MTNRRPFVQLIGAIALFGLAFYLRFHALGARFVDIDEAFSIYTALQQNVGALLQVVGRMGPIQQILDFLIDHAVWAFSPEFFSLRVVKAAWGVLAVMGVYGWSAGSRDTPSALLTAFLLAVAPFHVEYSQTVRYYSLITLLSVTTLWSFFRFAAGKAPPYLFALSVLLFQTVYPFAAVAATALLFSCWRWRPALTRGVALALIPTALWLVAWFAWIGRRLPETTFHYPLTTIFQWDTLRTLFLRFGLDNVFTATVLLFLFSASFFLVKKDRDEHFEPAALLAVGVSAFLAIFAAIIFLRLLFHVRYFIALLPVYLYLAVWSLRTLFKNERLFLSAAVVVAVLAYALSAPVVRREAAARAFVHQIFIDNARALTEKARAGDLVVYSNPNMGATHLLYLSVPGFAGLRPPGFSRGFLIFQFPQNYETDVAGKKLQVAALCSVDAAFSTFDRESLAQWLDKRKDSTVWLVNIGVNYFKQADPFGEGLGISTDQLVEEGPGLYRLKVAS